MHSQALAVLRTLLIAGQKRRKPDQEHPQYMAYVLQQPCKEGQGHLQWQQIIVSSGIKEMLEWCNSFELVPKPSRKEQLCLDPSKLNQVLIRPIHRGLTMNDIS